MKANELMIGDWVIDGTQPAQVTGITCGGVIETTANEHSNIEVVEPIPLTAEILEKNDFDSDRDNKIFAYNEGMAFVEVSLASNYINIDYDCTDEYGASSTFIKPDISALYVHDIQHFLRICGFKKEIEL